jgi:hypothetical protein
MPAEYSPPSRRHSVVPFRRPPSAGAVLAAGVWKAFPGIAAGVGRLTVPTDGRSAGVFCETGAALSLRF